MFPFLIVSRTIVIWYEMLTYLDSCRIFLLLIFIKFINSFWNEVWSIKWFWNSKNEISRMYNKPLRFNIKYVNKGPGCKA